MKVLVVMRHSGYVRNFESTLRMLCERGHHVHLAFQNGTHWLLDPGDVTREMAGSYRRFTRGGIPVREDAWGQAARELRTELDYLRYLSPEYRNAPKLRERAMRDVPEPLLRRMQGPMGSDFGRAAVSKWFHLLHRAVPRDPAIDAYLEVVQPDVLVVTPLVQPGAPQAEYLRSARALGIRTALCVASWDNLTNKGLIHGPVDLVTVWNEMMKAEAVTLHGVPAERVAVTGAQPFDHWFDWRPSTERGEFCGKVGLPADWPYILYLCSSRFIAPDEVRYVRAWLQSLRTSAYPSLRQAGVLIRPHPQNADQWRNVDLGGLGPVAVWPAAGAPPADTRTRSDYFDSMYHSAAVVGVNTTAEIESAIVGRGVYTMLAPEFRDTQEGTLHFEHLRSAEGGLVHVAENSAQHLEQLDAALRGGHDDAARCRRFVEAFVRPHGIDVPATPRLVEALESLAQRAPSPVERAPIWAPLAWPILNRRGHELVREAARDVETKTMRRARRKEEPAAAKAAQAEVKSGWRDLAKAYRTLEYDDRVRFGNATMELTPAEVQLETIRPERLDYPHADVYLRVTSKAERKRLLACSKEPFTIQWIEQCVRAGDVFYDVGANVGGYSLVAVKKPSGAARVVAFEPAMANMASLCANIVLNEAAGHVTPVPVALSDCDGMTTLRLQALQAGSARHALALSDTGDGSRDAGVWDQPVLTYRLDEAIDRFGLPAPNHIKLDVDGGELAVLRGAARTLALPTLRTMLVEVSAPLSEELTQVLGQHGLRLESKFDVTNKAGERLVWYGLFTRP